MRHQSHQDLVVVPYVTERRGRGEESKGPEGRTGEMGKGVCGSMERSGDSVMLFGKMIRVPAAAGGEHQKSQGLTDQDPGTEIQEKDQESSGSGEGSSRKSDETEENASDEQGVAATARASKLELEKNDKDDKSNSREKAPKKPEKILPCPRCNSNDTKFCYFNNYNVNQPRHFCRNCQRYWTAGGCMRNVPVGAGRRKSKSSAATQHRQATMQSAASGIVPFAISDQTTGAVLSFGPEVAGLNSRRTGEEKEYSNGSSVTAATTSTAGEERETQMFQGCPIGPLWVYQWNSSPHPGHQIPLYPASATTQWPYSAQGAWGMPRLPLLPAQDQSLASEPTLSLGKHSRDGHMLAHGTKLNRLLIPRTMRIDDPRDAADSSVWLGIGVENGKGGGAGLFKAFGSNDEASSVRMHPNPAALSRSLLFRETAQ